MYDNEGTKYALATTESFNDKLTGKETLGQLAKRWVTHANVSATWGNWVANEVLDVAERWADYKVDAKGKSPTAWLRDVFGPGWGLARFRRIEKAFDDIGDPRGARNAIASDVAVWVAGNVPSSKRAEVVRLLVRGKKDQGGHVLTLAQARRLTGPVIGKTKKIPFPKADETNAYIDDLKSRLEIATQRVVLLEGILDQHDISYPK